MFNSERDAVSVVVVHFGTHGDGLGFTECRIGLHGTSERRLRKRVVVRELRQALDKLHFDGVQRPVTVLGQNQFPQPGRVDAIRVFRDAVVLGAVNEGHDVGVLLDRA